MKKFLAISLFSFGLMANASEQLPIIQTKYNADPAPMVHNDTIFLYTSHDEDDAHGYGFKMQDWLLYSSTDMVNWTEHGAVASLKDFSWVNKDNGAWAIQVVERNGKFYMYCPIHGNGIGVLVADSPYGPFKDPIGKPLVWQKEHWDDIDPTVMIDDDGQAYMYWGNPNLYYVRLNDDMISYSGDIHKFDSAPEHYQEGPWLYKRGDLYYLAFASTCCPEGIGYAMSNSPTGPWESKGYIMRPTERTRGNHPGIADYKGKTYVFGHSYDILRLETPDHHERRSVNAAEMEYNSDGTIKEVPYWKDIELKQIEPFNPFRRVEAETMAWGFGLKTRPHGVRNMVVTDIDNGEYLCLRGVDFGKKGAKKLSVCVASSKNGSCIKVRIDAKDGAVIGTLPVDSTGSDDSYSLLSCKLEKVKGIHDLYFTFEGDGEDLFNFDYWELK
ncbi:MAG: glycoside hydrolase family 43 protein [Duncaniella sp.]|nr:glycoside hydrolase family 43 protein [Duncaniella sp.]